MAEPKNDQFFATQIAQKGAESPQQVVQSPDKKEQSPTKQDPKSLKNLLMIFNTYDSKQKGVITIQQAKKIFEQKGVLVDKFDVHYKIAMPLQNGFVAFDQFLFVFGLCEDESLDVDHKYELCKKVDKRLVQFLKLLNNYRKRSQSQANYKQAKKSKAKIQQIKQRELERRKKYLGILHEHEISQLEEKQKKHFQQFCNNWDTFMMDYEKTAADLIEKLQQKHDIQLKEFEAKLRQQLASKMRFSKQVIELQARQKSLVKLQEYEKAQQIQREIQDVKSEEIQKKLKLNEETIQAKCTNLKKQQLSAVSNLLQNIQKDRNDQLKQRKQDSDKLIVRNKNLINEINHKHNEAIKKIYQALHSIYLEGDKSKGIRKNGNT